MGRMLDALRKVGVSSAIAEAAPAAPPSSPVVDEEPAVALAIDDPPLPGIEVETPPLPAIEVEAPSVAATASIPPARAASGHEQRAGPDPQFEPLAARILADRPAGRPWTVALAELTAGPLADCFVPLVFALAQREGGPTLAVDADFDHPLSSRCLGLRRPSEVRLPEAIRRGDLAAARRAVPSAPYEAIVGGRLDEDRAATARARLAALIRAGFDRDLTILRAGSLEAPWAVELAAACDAIYLALDLGSGRRAAREALRALERARGRVAGCLLFE